MNPVEKYEWKNLENKIPFKNDYEGEKKILCGRRAKGSIPRLRLTAFDLPRMWPLQASLPVEFK